MTRRSVVAAGALLLGVALTACEADLETARKPAPKAASFGETIYQEACQRVAYLAQRDEQAAGTRATIDVTGAYDPVCANARPAPADAPLKLQALTGERSPIISAVDQILPQDFLDRMEAFLEAIVVLDDDGTMQSVMSSAGAVMQKMIDDRAFGDALARLGPRVGYRPLASAAGLAHAIFGVPTVDDSLAAVLDVILDADGNPVKELTAVLTAVSRELAAAQPLDKPGDPGRTLALALSLLLRSSSDAGDGKVRPALLRDYRGFALVASDPAAPGPVPPPFADNHGATPTDPPDGLPDLDPTGRRPVGADGKPLMLPPPFPVPGAAEDPKAIPRDALGRLLRASDMQPVYRDRDLDGTVLSALVRESATLLDPGQDNVLGLLHGAGALLGPRLERTRDYKDAKGAALGSLKYQGFDTDQSALLDLVHAFVQVLQAPRARDAVVAARTLLSVYEDPASRAVAAMLNANDRGKRDNMARIPATSNLYDEIVPLIVRVLRAQDRDDNGTPRSLMMDLLDAMQNPHTANLAPNIAMQMAYNDHFVLDQANPNGFGSVSGSFSTKVDRSQPDNDFNRSVMQRMAHLVHDANGVQFCNKQGAQIKVIGIPFATYNRCEMFRIDDLALFFVLSMADHSVTASQYAHDFRYDTTYSKASFREALQSGTLRTFMPDSGFTDSLLQGSLLTNIDGFTRFPTSPAAARSLFLDPAHQSGFINDTIDPIVCSAGDRFIDAHYDSMFAWETPVGSLGGDSFYDAVRPLVTAFALHDECVDAGCSQKRNAAKIFVDLMATLHVHWASPNSMYAGHAFQATDPTAVRFSTGDKLVSYEPLLADILGNSDLVPSISNLAPVLQRMTVDGNPGSPAALPVLLETMSFLFDPLVTPASIAYRDHRTSTVQSDGTTPVARATPYYLIADAFAKKRAQLDAAPADRQGAWRSATSTLVDESLTDEVANGAHRAKNRKLHGVLLALLDYVLERYDAHKTAGDFDSWVQKGLVGDIADATGGPIFASLIDLTAVLEQNPDAVAKLYGLLQGVVDPAASDATFTTALTAAADALQVLLDDNELVPIAHTLGAILDPAAGAVPLQLRLIKRARALDPNRPAAGDTMHMATLGTVLRNLFQPKADGAPTPISDLADAISEVNRVRPGSGGDFEGDDYRHVFGEIKSFLTDEQRGFVHFIDIVKSRNQ